MFCLLLWSFVALIRFVFLCSLWPCNFSYFAFETVNPVFHVWTCFAFWAPLLLCNWIVWRWLKVVPCIAVQWFLLRQLTLPCARPCRVTLSRKVSEFLTLPHCQSATTRIPFRSYGVRSLVWNGSTSSFCSRLPLLASTTATPPPGRLPITRQNGAFWQCCPVVFPYSVSKITPQCEKAFGAIYTSCQTLTQFVEFWKHCANHFSSSRHDKFVKCLFPSRGGTPFTVIRPCSVTVRMHKITTF